MNEESVDGAGGAVGVGPAGVGPAVPLRAEARVGPVAGPAYRIEDLAHHSGATVRTIRAYQDRGLLPAPSGAAAPTCTRTPIWPGCGR